MKNLFFEPHEAEKFVNLFNIYLQRLKISFSDESENYEDEINTGNEFYNEDNRENFDEENNKNYQQQNQNEEEEKERQDN